MKLTKTLPETEVQEFIKKFKGKSYDILSRNGKLIKVDTDDKTIISWAKSKGLT